MTIEEFQLDPERMKKFRAIMESETMRDAMSVMVELAPERKTIQSNVSPHYAHILFGQSRGYAEYAASLLQLAVYEKPSEPLESTYKPDDEETEN